MTKEEQGNYAENLICEDLKNKGAKTVEKKTDVFSQTASRDIEFTNQKDEIKYLSAKSGHNPEYMFFRLTRLAPQVINDKIVMERTGVPHSDLDDILVGKVDYCGYKDLLDEASSLVYINNNHMKNYAKKKLPEKCYSTYIINRLLHGPLYKTIYDFYYSKEDDVIIYDREYIDKEHDYTRPIKLSHNDDKTISVFIGLKKAQFEETSEEVEQEIREFLA